MDSVWATLSTIAGLLVAVGIFLLAARLVTRARKGNRRVRQARHDPHAPEGEPAEDPRDARDISQ